MGESGFLVAIAATFALLAGYFLSTVLLAWVRRRRPSDLLRREMRERAWVFDVFRRGPVELILEYVRRVTQRLELGSLPRGMSERGVAVDSLTEEQRLLMAAGLASDISSRGLMRARVELAVIFAVIGFVPGACLSGVLTLLLAGVGFCSGWRLPSWAVAKRVRERAEIIERCLPEMLDVVSLGLRSGLSFDAALAAYCSHFENLLAVELGGAMAQWERGLVSRDEALANVSLSFDSPSLKRVLGDIARSLRYGSALTGSLETVARQVRKEYRARKEEEVAKAPVKMMIPTGVLILPAMLILVLGPVMLELMAGF